MSGFPTRPDNRTGGPARPLGVTPDELEQAVRESLARQVAVPRPLAADLAGLAIRQADRIRRRRTLTGVALAAVATVAVSAGMVQLGQGHGGPRQPTVVLGDPYASALASPPPAPSAAVPVAPDLGAGRAEVDLLLGDVLATSDGRRLTLAGVGPAERAQRLPEGGGWLVSGAPTAAGRSLWLVLPDGSVSVLLAGAEEIALTPDGRQVAWREGAELVAAGIVGTQLVATVRTPAPAAAAPAGFVGDAVLVRLDPDRPGHALWRPAAGPLETGTDQASLHLYGTRQDGLLVGQVSAGTPRRACLALLDPARGLAQVRTGCGPALSADGYGAVSLDGRWLLVNGRTDGRDSALLVDLDRLGSAAAARPAGPPVRGVVAWTPHGCAIHADADGRLVRVEVDRVLGGESAVPTRVSGLRPGESPLPVTGADF
ncbi:hypothetical protein [Micromonospora deserti]|uniref:Uncharacterized protein n=1 Tax=Micromonospora deserti TaxID=2070366 RepID=A0A2W2DBH0_9ACTN|nr:hypothetical protein [Micromonospora deserti]PZF97197.1 hypothetical protein C1I99_16100 [Micromonospora deserti]